MKNRRVLVALSAMLFVCAWQLFGEPISFSADKVESALAKDKERTVLTGRCRITTGAVSISADNVELFGKDFSYMICSGNVRIIDTDRKIKLFTPKLYYDRVAKLAKAEGPSQLEDEKNKVIVKAESIENQGNDEITIAQVAVRIIKEKLICRGEYVIFRSKEKSLELTGAPVAYKEGDIYRASRMRVNTDTEDIFLDGDVSGNIVSQKKPAATGTTTTTAPAATPVGPAGAGSSVPGATPPTNGAPTSPAPGQPETGSPTAPTTPGQSTPAVPAAPETGGPKAPVAPGQAAPTVPVTPTTPAQTPGTNGAPPSAGQ